MTEQHTPALKRFGQPAGRWGRSKRAPTKERSSSDVDPLSLVLDAAEGMPKLLKPEQAAASLGVSERTLERWRMTGEGPTYVSLTRKTVRYPEQALAAFVVARLRANTAQ